MLELHTNLVSDSALVQETVDMLRVSGGRAPAADIADLVLKLPELDTESMLVFIQELIKDDQRLSLTNELMVQLESEDVETRLLRESPFVVVDVEATSAKAPPGRITEIGAYRIERGRIVAEFVTLVNPEIPIPPFVVGLTGITNEMVQDAPLFEDIASDWLRFAGDAVLVAHNAQFDTRFLNHEVSRMFPGRRMGNSNICTVNLSRSAVPGLLNYRLPTVAQHFDIPILRRHRAGDDALATAEVFLRILDRLYEYGVRDLAEARRFNMLQYVV